MLTLYYHPLSSYCWKALIGLYERDVEFTPAMVNLGDPAARAAFLALWPIGKFPLIRDDDTGSIVPEASIILAWLDRHRPGPAPLTPTDPDQALNARLLDRIIDLHLHDQVQKVVGDRLRPEGQKDPTGVADARAKMVVTYGYLENALQGRTWLTGDDFGLVECAALPALFYGDKVQPLTEDLPLTKAYLDRLKARPSVARVLQEAEPYFQFFPAG
jgi:glutathione S-transferase